MTDDLADILHLLTSALLNIQSLKAQIKRKLSVNPISVFERNCEWCVLVDN